MPKQKYVCEQCGEVYERYPSLKGRFCSMSCRCKWQSVHQRGAHRGKYSNYVVLVCEQCGEVFEVVPSLAKKRFCNRACHSKWMSENWTGENHPKWRGGNARLVMLTCRACGAVFGVIPQRAEGARVCSKVCLRKWKQENQPRQWGEDNPGWRGGISFEPYTAEFTEALKETVRERDKKACRMCGMIKEENKRTLPVHHIDYNKANSQPSNLITFCDSCHGRTNGGDREQWTVAFQRMMSG